MIRISSCDSHTTLISTPYARSGADERALFGRRFQAHLAARRRAKIGSTVTQAGVPVMQDVQQPRSPAPQREEGRPTVARMPKAQALRIASGLKKIVLVASVALFGGFAALVAGNVVGVTAQSSSSGSQSSDSIVQLVQFFAKRRSEQQRLLQRRIQRLGGQRIVQPAAIAGDQCFLRHLKPSHPTAYAF